MDFDQMLEAWRGQEEMPLYGVNQDLLRLVLQNEQAKIRRTMRRDQWITYLVGPGMALFAAFWGWVAVLNHVRTIYVVAAAVGTITFAVWVAAFWVSRQRQSRRERAFGNNLKDEIGRNLSLVEYQISNGRWGAVLLWTLPVLIGATLIYWLSFQINTDTGFTTWTHITVTGAIIGSVVISAYAADRQVKRKLDPRRRRLRELLQTLNAGE